MVTNSRFGDETPRTFKFGDFTYDSGTRLLTSGGTRRHLSPKAQQLLYLLLMARPRVLSREDLYDALWPSTFVCETNLAGLVNEIRRVLGDHARAAQLIRTVHGFGYAFEGEVASAAYVPVLRATLVCGDASYRLSQGDNSIGRSPESDVLLLDRTISRRHAVITIGDDESSFLIRDLNSRNGTYIDGRKIDQAPVLVTRGAKIKFGTAEISVELARISRTRQLTLNTAEVNHLISAYTTTA